MGENRFPLFLCVGAYTSLGGMRMMKRIVTWDSPMTSMRQKWFSEQLQAICPWLECETLTWTAGGREVEALRLGRGDRTVLLTGGHHANESITGLLLWRFLEDYCRGLLKNGKLHGFCCRGLFRRSTLYLVPLVNPDGADLTAGAAAEEEIRQARNLWARQPELPFPQGWKANLQGVDLNLNYPARWETAKAIKPTEPGPRDFPGWQPLDQPETEALAEFTRRICPDVMGTWHTQGGEIYAADHTGRLRAEKLSRMMERVSGYTLTDPPPESSNAGFRDWFLQELSGAAFTIEAGRGTNPLPLSDLPRLYEENLPLFTLLLAHNS